MGSLGLTLCTGLLAVTALTTTAAHAAHAADTEGTTGVTTTPSSPAPGTDITLRANGCTTRTGTATSAAFVAEVRLTGTEGTLVGETRVRTELKAGSYDVQVTCGDSSRKSVLTVVDQSTRPSPHTSPIAPVQAGGGGTARLASVDEARATGPGTAQTVTGLVLAGVAAAAAVALRRVRRSRGTD